MPITADQTQAQTTTPVDLGAIFVSLEVSKSTCLVTALSPGNGNMSRTTSLEAILPACSRVLTPFARRHSGVEFQQDLTRFSISH